MQHGPRRPWRTLAAVALTTLALPAVAHAAPATQDQIDTAIQRGAAWITTQPDATGLLRGFNGEWGPTALAAAGINAADVRLAPGDPSVQDYTASVYEDAAWGTLPSPKQASDLGREALISSSAGIAPTKIAPDVNLAASLASLWDADEGNFGGGSPNNDGQAILVADLLHLPRGVVRKVDTYLRSTQKVVDGGWNYTPGPGDGTGDLDVTGMVLSMLCQAGARASDPAVKRGLDFLQTHRDLATGAFGSLGWTDANNTSTAAMALIGLKACGVDPQGAAWTTPSGENLVTFLLGQQRSGGVDGSTGSFKYVPTSPPIDPVYGSMDTTQVAVRALSNHRWSAPAPARANPADPRLRPVPAVADGTVVPVAVGVDNGAGDVRLCAVRIPAGTPLTDVLQTASTTSVPGGCVRDLQVADGGVAALNGVTGVDGRGWLVQVNGQAPQLAGPQRIGFGDVVSLQYDWYTTKQVTVPGPGTVVTIVREVTKTVPAKVTKKPAKATAVCRVQRGKKSAKDRVRCTVKHAPGTSKRSTARLTRKGRLFAQGTRSLLRQHGQRRLVVGHHYTLRLGKGKKITKIRVTLR